MIKEINKKVCQIENSSKDDTPRYQKIFWKNKEETKNVNIIQ